MDIFDALKKRHSYRGGYSDKPVSREDLVKIVNAAIQAPSGCNEQTTTFVIIDDESQIKEIAQLLGKEFVSSAKAIIACVVDFRKVYHDMSFAVEDCSAAVENMLLAITALGYATVWLDGCLRLDDRERKLADMLEVPDGLEIRILLPIGVPEEQWDPKPKKSFEERASFNSYTVPADNSK